jgi:estrone sulfotransferase
VCKQAIGEENYKISDEEAKFMRKGKAGDWKNHFSPETVARFEAWEKNGLEGTDLKFCYEV